MDPRLLLTLFLLFALPLALVVWGCQRPRPAAVQVALALALLAYQWLYYAYAREVLWSIEHLALMPLYAVLVPLALLLGGLTQVRNTSRPGAYLTWVGLAVTGLVGLLLLPVAWLPVGLLDTAGPQLELLAGPLLTFGLNVLAWLLVLRLLAQRHHLRPVLWQPWWRLPTVAAIVLINWSVLDAGLLLSAADTTNKSSFSFAIPWKHLSSTMLLSAGLRWVAGVVVLRMRRVSVLA